MLHKIIYPSTLLEMLPRNNTLFIPHGSFWRISSWESKYIGIFSFFKKLRYVFLHNETQIFLHCSMWQSHSAPSTQLHRHIHAMRSTTHSHTHTHIHTRMHIPRHIFLNRMFFKLANVKKIFQLLYLTKFLKLEESIWYQLWHLWGK